jgi:hypothetical protein
MIEAQRGYDSRCWLWSPGYFAGEIRKDCPLTLIAATEAWHTVLALSPDDALTFEAERRRRLGIYLVLPMASGWLVAIAVVQAAFFSDGNPSPGALWLASTRAEAGFMLSTIDVGIRIVVPRSLVVS